MRPACVAIAGFVVYLAVGQAAFGGESDKGVPRTLVDLKLQEHAVQLVAIDARTLTYTDAAGLLRTESMDEFLFFRPTDDGSGASTPLVPPAAVELTDGQRFAGSIGTISGAGSPSELLPWEHAALGPVSFKLDRIRRIQLKRPPDGSVPILSKGDNDVVILTNGDRAEGLVEGFLTAGPSARLSAGGQSRDIPLERIQEIRVLSNPPSAPQSGAVIAWLRDGSVIACRALHTSRTGELTIEPAPTEAGSGGPGASTLAAASTLTLADILAADLHPGAVIPVASLPVASQQAAPGRRWSRPVGAAAPESLLRLGDVELPGPMTAEWDLPAGVTRFAAEAELPRPMWNWGDCDIRVSLVTGGTEKELARQHLSADQPHALINAALDNAPAGARLRIRLEAGSYGPVQDRVVLRRPILLAPVRP